MAPEVPSSMHLSPLQLISESHFSVSGNVTIHPSAAIAPGVFLQADPGSEIVIAAEVCIGAGTILHAHAGKLEVEVGATLGAGVLMVGSGRVGKNACVGSRVTIWLSSIDSEQVIPAGSLIGDISRQVESLAAEPSGSFAAEPANAETPVSKPFSNPGVAATNPVVNDPVINNPPRGAMVPVYGQVALNRLIAALLPHRQMLNGSSPPDESSGNAQA